MPGSHKWSLSLNFPHQTPHISLLSSIRATCPTHLILLDFITRTIMGEEYRSLSSSLCSFLYSLYTSSLLDPNILLSALFTNTLGLRSSYVSHPYKTPGKNFISVYFNPQIFGYQTGRQKILHRKIASIPRLNFALSSIEIIRQGMLHFATDKFCS